MPSTQSGVRLRVLWFFVEFAATAILLVASLIFFLNFAIGGYFAERAGQGGDEFLFFYVYPGIISFFVLAWALYHFPARLLLFSGLYSIAEKVYRSQLWLLERMPGPKWFWTMGTLGRLADVLSLSGKDKEADETYALVGECSREGGIFSSLIVGPSLENYADRLARADKMIDYAEWKGRFRGANMSRRILSVLWLALTVVAAQMSFKLTLYQVPMLASSISYLGRYELADSVLRAAKGWINKYGDGKGADAGAVNVRIAENDIRWGRMAEAERIYHELLPVEDFLKGKLDGVFSSQPTALQGMRELALLKMRRGKQAQGEALSRKIFQISGRVSDRIALADCLWESGKTREAKEEYEKSILAATGMTDKQAAAPLLISAEIKLARLLAGEGQLGDANRKLDEARTRAETLRPEPTDQLLTLITEQMKVAFKQGERERGEDLRKRALSLAGKSTEIKSLAQAARLHQVADALIESNSTEGVDELLTAVSQAVKRFTDKRNPALSGYELDRARLAIKEKRYADAESLLSATAAALSGRGLGYEHPAVLKSYVLLGESQLGQHRFEEADANYAKAIALLEKRQVPTIPEYLREDFARYATQLKSRPFSEANKQAESLLVVIDANNESTSDKR